jgi:glycosidase
MRYGNLTISYNSHYKEFKSPFGAVTPDTSLLFRIRIEGSANLNVVLVITKEGNREIYREMTPEGTGYYTTLLTSGEPGLYFYYFRIIIKEENYDKYIYIGNNESGLGGEAQIYEDFSYVRSYQVTMHNYVKPSPAWYKDAVFYQIFVDRFHNGNEDGRILNPKKNSFLYSSWEDTPLYIRDPQGNILRWDFFGGNLKGVIKKLDYLKEMGISGIYLNPIFQARSNHKYDTGDYLRIDEMFGDEKIFGDLIIEAEKRGIKIILDGVFNHAGADSKYFNRFGTYDEVGAYQDRNSKYHDWFIFHNFPDDYECWWGVKDLPNLNEYNPEYRKLVCDRDGIIDKWTRFGIGGWRLDVADEITDDLIKEIRTSMENAKPDTVLIGEVWEDATNKISYGQRRKYLLGDELHSTMNYPLKDNLIAYLNGYINARDFFMRIMSLKENYPREAFYSAFNSMGTHDTRRIRTEIPDLERLKIAVSMVMTFPGVPCVYYGDEAGMTGERDPYNRGPYPWGREDTDIQEHYKKMIATRKESEAFTSGDFIPFYQGNLFGYLRIGAEDTYIVIINRDDEERRLILEDAEGLHDIPEELVHILSGEFHVFNKTFNMYQL